MLTPLSLFSPLLTECITVTATLCFIQGKKLEESFLSCDQCVLLPNNTHLQHAVIFTFRYAAINLGVIFKPFKSIPSVFETSALAFLPILVPAQRL